MIFKNFNVKKIITSIIAVLVIMLPFSSTASAELPDVEVLGGPYYQVRRQAYDIEKYHIHYLIAKEAWI